MDAGGREASSQQYIDLFFKLNHLSRADTRRDVWDVGTRQPPFSRFFIPDDEVLQHYGSRRQLCSPQRACACAQILRQPRCSSSIA